MNRTYYFNYIEQRLHELAQRINNRGKLNILDLNIHCESFYTYLLNLVFTWDLQNMNMEKQNVEGIDLIDKKNKLIIQISSTNTKKKINNSLNKKIYQDFLDYTFKFISISKDVKNLKKDNYINPYEIKFNPSEDIIGIIEILKIIQNMSIDKQKELFEFCKEELGNEIDIYKVDTNLAIIIGILSDENLVDIISSSEINSFEIEKKIEFNDLIQVKDTIDDYKIYYNKLNQKYSEFDALGKNKSLSVFNLIKKEYRLLSNKDISSCDIFYELIEKIKKTVMESKNYIDIPYEELEMCVFIIVVDTFIRCKIFKNPEGYNHVIT